METDTKKSRVAWQHVDRVESIGGNKKKQSFEFLLQLTYRMHGEKYSSLSNDFSQWLSHV